VQRDPKLCTGDQVVRRTQRNHDSFPGMNRMLTVVAAGRGGWFNRSDARACGYTDTEIRERLRAGR